MRFEAPPVRILPRILPTSGAAVVISGLDSTLGDIEIKYRCILGGTPTNPNKLVLTLNSFNSTYTQYVSKNNSAQFSIDSLNEIQLGQNTETSGVKFSGGFTLDAPAHADRFLHGRYSAFGGGGMQWANTWSAWLTNASAVAITSVTLTLSGGTPTWAAGSWIDVLQYR
jgi:hypothetical protein